MILQYKDVFRTKSHWNRKLGGNNPPRKTAPIYANDGLLEPRLSGTKWCKQQQAKCPYKRTNCWVTLLIYFCQITPNTISVVMSYETIIENAIKERTYYHPISGIRVLCLLVKISPIAENQLSL